MGFDGTLASTYVLHQFNALSLYFGLLLGQSFNWVEIYETRST